MPSLIRAPNDNLVCQLKREALVLNMSIGKGIQDHTAADRERYRTKDDYADYVKRHDKLADVRESLQVDLFYAVADGDPRRINDMEQRLNHTTAELFKVDNETPAKIKAYSAAVKKCRVLEEHVKDLQRKFALKEEELHRYRPCQIYLCNHCRARQQDDLNEEHRPRRRFTERFAHFSFRSNNRG